MTPEALAHLCRSDKKLARLIKKVGPCTMKPHSRRTPFVALVTAVTHQQLNGTAAQTIAKLTNEEIIERLTTVRGVGPWTVEMLLMFTLGRLDVLPATDYGVRKGFALTFGWKDLPTPKELLEYGERWRPHRTTASW